MLSYKQIYQDLLKERTTSLEIGAQISQSAKKHYDLVCKNIANIERPIREDFLEKVAYVKKNHVSLDNLSNSSDSFFLDGTSIFLWYSSLVDFYVEGKMKEEEIGIFLDMYKTSLKEERFISSFLYIQMALRMVDKEKFCAFLGIKPYLYRNLCYSCFGKKALSTIKETLLSKDLSSFHPFQQIAIKEFLSVLEETIIAQEQDTSKQVKEKQIIIFRKKDKKIWLSRINEILHYIRVNKVSRIPGDALFSNGMNMKQWYESHIKSGLVEFENLELMEIKKKGFYQIIKEFYNSNTFPPHKRIPLDYGSSLRRVSAFYHLSLEQLYSSFQIPGRFILQIMENKIVPTEKFVLSVISFLRSLPITSDYEREFVEEAISVYENLKEMHLKGDSLSFTIFSKVEESKYLALWKDFDSSILEKVKECKYDWYLKCLTIYYIISKERKSPTSTMQYYFYDGSSADKWLTTQKRTLEGVNKLVVSQEQVAMLQHIYHLLEQIEKESISPKNEDILLTDFDFICQSFAEAIEKFDGIPSCDYYKNVPLKRLWDLLGSQLKERNLPYTCEQIVKIKELRYKVIYNQKKKNKFKNKMDLEFSYNFACFLDGLGLDLEEASLLFGIPSSTLSSYFGKNFLPSKNMDKMISSLEQLDLSSYREDQVEDIKQFIKVLSSLKKKTLLIEMDFMVEQVLPSLDISLLTGNLLKDVSLSNLKEIKETDIEWYEEFQKLYSLIYQSLDKDANLSLIMHKWFRYELCEVEKGKSTAAKGELLRYLYYFNQKVCSEKKEISFMKKFPSLESFIYEHKRVPLVDELPLSGDTDGKKFYRIVRNNFYGIDNTYQDLSASLKGRMKILIQYVEYCRRESKGYQKDKIEGEKLFLGERLNNLRICLEFSFSSFCKKMSLGKKEWVSLYSNKKSLSAQHIEELLLLLKEMEGKSLREDQIKEIQDFRFVITTKQLDEHFSFKFVPKK